MTLVEENLYALFRVIVATMGGDIDERPALSRHHTASTNPYCKSVWRARLTSEETEAAIDETLAWFDARGARYCCWWTGPGTAPADFRDRLAARGMTSMFGEADMARGIPRAEAGAPVMEADLHAMREDELARTPAGFRIERVLDDAALEIFRRINIEVYRAPAWAVQPWIDATRANGIDRAPWRMYLGVLGATPVATSMIFDGAGAAGVFHIATMPEARGKGIGGAITLAPLLESRERGLRRAVLFASEIGVPVYERIGFRLAGYKLDRYLWQAGP